MFFRKLALCLSVAGILIGAGPALADNFTTLATGGVGGWLNVTHPVREEDMKGRLVLLDFWTYGCINCMQVVPDLAFLEQKYGDNLMIIGVHSAKFKGEQGNARILAAAKRFGLKHPVINDADFAIWKSFGVEAWPTQVLLGPNGQEISRYEGEGHRADLDADIEPAVKTLHPIAGRASVASFVPNKVEEGVLSFPARIKKSGDYFYIADSGHNRIMVVDRTGRVIKIFDGLHNPRGFDVAGDMLYVADTGAHQVVRIDMTKDGRTVLGGDGTRGREWASPWDVAVLPNQKLLVAMAGTHQLQVIDLVLGRSDVFAGNGRENIKDGDVVDAELAQPSGLSVTSNGDIYFVDAESSALRVTKDGQVKTLIGTGLFDFGLVDGVYPSARLQHAQGLFVQGDKVYVADTYNNAIRVYDLASGQLTTIKTTGENLNEPGSIWVGDDYALITDTNNNRILKLDLKTNIVSVWKITENTH